jgi:hypothetical protein
MLTYLIERQRLFDGKQSLQNCDPSTPPQPVRLSSPSENLLYHNKLSYYESAILQTFFQAIYRIASQFGTRYFVKTPTLRRRNEYEVLGH